MPENYCQKKINIEYAIHLLGFITGGIGYLCFYLVFSDGYLNFKDRYFAKDLIMFLISVGILCLIGFLWVKIYKQFRKDKTKLGFSPDKKWSSVVLLALFEIFIVILGILSHPGGF